MKHAKTPDNHRHERDSGSRKFPEGEARAGKDRASDGGWHAPPQGRNEAGNTAAHPRRLKYHEVGKNVLHSNQMFSLHQNGGSFCLRPAPPSRPTASADEQPAQAGESCPGQEAYL